MRKLPRNYAFALFAIFVVIGVNKFVQMSVGGEQSYSEWRHLMIYSVSAAIAIWFASKFAIKLYSKRWAKQSD